jgi:hypothetical protein
MQGLIGSSDYAAALGANYSALIATRFNHAGGLKYNALGKKDRHS